MSGDSRTLAGDVRRVRDHEIDGAADRVEQVAADEADAVGDAMAGGVPRRDGERRRRDVRRDDAGVGELARERDREAAAAGADVEDPRRPVVPAQGARRLDDQLAFGARDEDVGGDFEVQSPELTVAGDEGHRLAARSPIDERRIAGGEGRRRRLAAVGHEPGAIPAEGVPRQDFGVDRRRLALEAGVDQRLARRRDVLVDRAS